jgi:3-hydroxymyristoyl/3-hydroxydecanoyl-(acyl carrier protein) dehydratase
MTPSARPARSLTLAWEAPVVTTSAGRATASVRVRVPPDYAFFDGHFPGYPVLAGAVQLHEFVLPCLRRVRGGRPAVRRIAGLKFPRRIRPGDAVEVRLAWEPGGRGVEFELRVDGGVATHGRLELASDGDPDAG